MFIISTPGFSGELREGFGRLTASAGKAIAGSGPVVNVRSPLLSVVPVSEHCACACMWYVVDAVMPATRMLDVC
jgi:hypothetical protein